MQLYHRFVPNQTVKKHLFIIALGAILGISIYYYLAVSNVASEQVIRSTEALLAVLCGVLTAYVFFRLSLKLDDLIPWNTQMANRLFVGVLTHFLSAGLLIIGCFYVYNNYVLGVQTPFKIYEPTLIKLTILLFVLSLLYTIIYFALFSYYTYASVQIAKVKEERRRIQLQLKALKSQLSPHFLFNSLNTISSLIYKSEDKAEAYIRRLASIYQYTLNSYHEKLVGLKQELEVVKAYQFLLNTRYENKITSSIEIPAELHITKIPPLTLQMLIENAVKHNVLMDENPLKVCIKAEGDFIVVENTITQAPVKVDSFNIGLSNIKARYRLLCNEEVIVNKGTSFMVKLPVIK